MRTSSFRIVAACVVLVALAAVRAQAQPFGLFANAYLDSSRVPTARISVEVPFRTLVFLKKEGYYDARYDAQISVRAADADRPADTYVLHGFATVKTYDETRRRDQKSRAWREIALPPGDYVIDALLTIKNTSIGMRRSVTLRVPDFLASGMAFGTPTVLSVPDKFRPEFARWSEVSDRISPDSPPDGAVAGFEREPAVRFELFVDGNTDLAVACDVFYEVVDAADRQLAYAKRRVTLSGRGDAFVAVFDVDEWSPGTYRVNLRARTYAPERDATASVEIRIDVTRAMLGADFDATLEILGLIANQSELKPLRDAPELERPAAWKRFWAARDPDPSSDENEALVQHLERVEYVAREFSQFGPGYRSDRGRVYIRYGAPEQIDTALDQRAQGEYEIWRYYTLNREFVFFDMFGVGDFKLVEGDL
jgi:GWxTD domain-containing protein